MNSGISNYINLIESFKNGRINANQFEKDYLFLFKNDKDSINYSDNIFNELDSLFSKVDEYCDDIELRRKLAKSFNDEELLDAARKALDKILIISNKNTKP